MARLGKARSASAVMALLIDTYHAGAAGLSMTSISQVTTNCVLPPEIATPMA